MCEITYDNLTICIGFHEDLCVHVEQQQPKKCEADPLSGEAQKVQIPEPFPGFLSPI